MHKGKSSKQHSSQKQNHCVTSIFQCVLKMSPKIINVKIGKIFKKRDRFLLGDKTKTTASN